LQGIQKSISVRQAYKLHLKNFCRKGCPLYPIQVINSTESKELKVEDHPVLWEFKNMFSKEVPGLPPKIDLDFSIDIEPRAVLASKVPYRMTTLELVELKVQPRRC
jgi:hypothetical protein